MIQVLLSFLVQVAVALVEVFVVKEVPEVSVKVCVNGAIVGSQLGQEGRVGSG